MVVLGHFVGVHIPFAETLEIGRVAIDQCFVIVVSLNEGQGIGMLDLGVFQSVATIQNDLGQMVPHGGTTRATVGLHVFPTVFGTV